MAINGNVDFTARIYQYEQFDKARHLELSDLALEYEQMKSALKTLRDDLDDERSTRRSWRQRAEAAENATARNQFALVLVDGDGYIFNQSFMDKATSDGGAEAAHALRTDVLQYLREEGVYNSNELEVMVIVYLNKNGLAKALSDANIIRNENLLDQFLWSFTQSTSLFQVVDIGHGKERADSKLRDTYRFYAYNAQCKHIFLACAHDSGYVAELDKYRHDPIAAPKTILVKNEQMARQYLSLPFPTAKLTTLFNCCPSAPQPVRRAETYQSTRLPTRVLDDASPTNSVKDYTTPSLAPTAWSTVTAGSRDAVVSPSEATARSSQLTKTMSESNQPSTSRQIPINHRGARVDRHITPPSSSDLDRFERHILEHGKICNSHHLAAAGCHNYNCAFDHFTIDDGMKNTLRFKARAIACTAAGKCRKGDCFFGHICPWGTKCANPKCKFDNFGGHGEDGDGEIVKYVPAA